MGARDGLLLWVLGGAGILFLYSAWSKQHPAAVLGKTLHTTPPAPAGGAPVHPLDPSAGIDIARSTPALPPGAGVEAYGHPGAPGPYRDAPALYIPGTMNA